MQVALYFAYMPHVFVTSPRERMRSIVMSRAV